MPAGILYTEDTENTSGGSLLTRSKERRELDNYSGLRVFQYADKFFNFGYLSNREVEEMLDYLEMYDGIFSSNMMTWEIKQTIDDFVDRRIRWAHPAATNQKMYYSPGFQSTPIQTERADI